MNYLPIKNQTGTKPLTDMQLSLLGFLEEAEYDPVKAAELAGYKYPKDALTSVSLRKELVALAEHMIALDSLKAMALLRKVLTTNTPIPMAKEKIDVAKTLLDRAGIVKKDIVDINVSAKGGVFILPKKTEVVEGEFTVVNDEFQGDASVDSSDVTEYPAAGIPPYITKEPPEEAETQSEEQMEAI